MKTFFLSLCLCCSIFAQAKDNQYSIIVIGGGPAGLTCATSCSKVGYQTVLIDTEAQDLFAPAIPMTNWPGFPAETWKAALETLRKEYTSRGGTIVSASAESITRNQKEFVVSTKDTSFRAPVLVYAAGRHPPQLGWPIHPEKPAHILSRLWDESFIKLEDSVAIIGSGNQAILAATKAALRAKKVYLLLQPNAAQSTEVIPPIISSVITMTGTRIVKLNETNGRVSIEYHRTGRKLLLSASWVVFAYDWIPNTELVKTIVPRDSTGAIIVQGDGGATTVPGFFACGEVSSTKPLDGITASIQGLATANSACRYLLLQNELPIPPAPPAPPAPPPPPQQPQPEEKS